MIAGERCVWRSGVHFLCRFVDLGLGALFVASDRGEKRKPLFTARFAEKYTCNSRNSKSSFPSEPYLIGNATKVSMIYSMVSKRRTCSSYMVHKAPPTRLEYSGFPLG